MSLCVMTLFPNNLQPITGHPQQTFLNNKNKLKGPLRFNFNFHKHQLNIKVIKGNLFVRFNSKFHF